MGVRAKGAAVVSGPGGGKFTIQAGDVAWDEVDREERSMGLAIQHEGTAEVADGKEVTFSVWEYPEGALETTDFDGGAYTLESDFSYDFAGG